MLEELKKAFRARQFWVSFGTFFVVMLGYSLASWLGSISAGEYIWSVIALAISIWIPDKLLVVAIPAAIFYIWNADISFYVFGVPLPSPASLFNDGLWQDDADALHLRLLPADIRVRRRQRLSDRRQVRAQAES